VVETARLQLRPLVEADLDALVQLDSFRPVREAIDPFSDILPPDPAALREYERGLLARTDFLGAVERSSGRLLGWFQVQPSADAPGEIELGYRLRPDAWGKGYATEGAEVLLADALARPGVRRVYAHALLSNTASLRVLEKIGMVYAGPWAYRGLPGAEYEARGRPGAEEEAPARTKRSRP
jgi:RimJ/RimL family protein N-acetyltransferase